MKNYQKIFNNTVLKSLFVLLILMDFNATFAQTPLCPALTSGDNVVSVSCDDVNLITSGQLTINSSVTVSAHNNEEGVIQRGGAGSSAITVNGILNNGEITSTGRAARNGIDLFNVNITNRIENNYLITGFDTYGAGINIQGDINTTIGGITNNLNGIISGFDNGILIGERVSVGDIANYGQIKNTGSSTTYSSGILSYAGIDSISNFNGGTISGLDAGIYNLGTIGTLTNNFGATITSLKSGIVNDGLTNTSIASIASISNSGNISGGLLDDSGFGISNDYGTIVSITNNSGATITGGGLAINNNLGTIGTLINDGNIIGTRDTSTGIYTNSTINSLTNSGVISGGYSGVTNEGGTIDTLTNSGTIIGTSLTSQSYGIANSGVINNLTNNVNGTISGRDGGILNSGDIETLTNTGSIVGDETIGMGIFSNGRIGSITNGGIISGGIGMGIGVTNNGTIGTFTNTGAGAITGTVAIFNDGVSAVIGSSNDITTGIFNSGIIRGGDVGIYNGGSIVNISNNTGGVISGGVIGISNAGSISVLNNAQGGISSGGPAAQTALTYSGNLPTNYKIIINSSAYYGQLRVDPSAVGSTRTNFGIYSPSGVIDQETYVNVISGVTSLNFLNTITDGWWGTFGSAQWKLVQEIANPTYWDLVFSSFSPSPTPPSPSPSPTTSNTITGAGTTYQSSNLGTTLNPVFNGGTLQVSSAGTITNNFAVTANNGVIDQNGLASIFSGVITDAVSGTPGSMTIINSGNNSGSVTFAGTNTYTGSTTISTDATLALSGTGSIASSSGVINNGSFDISGTSAGAYVQSISGSGTTSLGTQTLTITNAAGNLAGAVSGTGGLSITGGTQTLSGNNAYTGSTTINNNATLALSVAGSIATSSGVINNGSFDISGTSAGASVQSISGSGTTSLGAQTLTITNAAGNLAGVVSGTGGLNITGGTQILSGINTYSGGTTVTAGILSVQGSSSTGLGDVNVSRGGMLMGRGTINGNVNVAGILKPGNSPGYLATQANVTMNTGSVYQQDIAGTTQASASSPVGATGYYSYLNSTGGQFIINTGSTLTPALSNLFNAAESGYGSTPYTPVLGDRFRIITADGGISGKFSSITQPAELTTGAQFLAFYNMAGSNSVDLAVIPTSYKTTINFASGNRNAQSVGSALDKMVVATQAGVSTNTQDQLLYATSTQNASSLPSYTQGLAGEVYAATVAVIAQTTQRIQQAVLTRLGDTMGIGLPSAMTNPSGNTALMAASNTALNGGVANASVNTNPAVNPNTEYKSLSNGNVWGDLAYQKGNRGSDSYSGGWNSNLYQLVFGSDFYITNDMRVGGGIALSSTTLNPTYGSGTIQQGSVFAYGKMPIQDYVVDAMASFGLNSSDLSRSDVTGLGNGFRNKTISGNDTMVSLGLSRPIDMDSLRITPYARVTWQMVTQSSINEGGAASALIVNGFTGNGVRGVLGVAAGSKANDPMTEKYTYRAYVGVGADSSGVLNPTLNASIAGMGTNITTPNAGSTFVQAGLYGTAKVSENAYAFAGLSGEARSGQTLGTVNIGLRVQF